MLTAIVTVALTLTLPPCIACPNLGLQAEQADLLLYRLSLPQSIATLKPAVYNDFDINAHTTIIFLASYWILGRFDVRVRTPGPGGGTSLRDVIPGPEKRLRIMNN